jgi:diaminohydroxyphosphoribosylaminopyrimidine deaminase/5-amino-6-(5-phosphoribosylamino)uracil reductase
MTSSRVTPDAAMRMALKLAERGAGRVWPNPSVGAVVFRGTRILGRGTTEAPGGAHAEVVALRSAERRFGARALRGASLAVTLEPCSHTGRTGPCVEAVIEAGVAKVFVGCRDTSENVAGRGLRRLRRAGLEVHMGLMQVECRAEHRGFLSVAERGRPFVTLKLASTLDGRIATASGESRWITSPPARRFVHQLRARTDAIAVGSGTALADDPDLTARRDSRIVHRPIRVLVDSRLQVPTTARLYRGSAARETWVLCRRDARGRKSRLQTGARVLEARAKGVHLDLGRALVLLGKEGITTLLVEGGGGLAAALLRMDLVDEIHWLIAPRLIGSGGKPALAELRPIPLSDAVSLRDVSTRRLGPDVHVKGALGEFQ